ncbi:MAG TPA: DUF547 domain-containing protein [bacterium]|nr:DUF547 domain-containing protein [bacterium]
MLSSAAPAAAQDLIEAKSYRVKGSGEAISSKPGDVQPPPAEAAPAGPQAGSSSLSELPANLNSILGVTNLPAAPPRPQLPPEYIYHEVENPLPVPVHKKPAVEYVNHEVFDRILYRYVSKSGWFDYRSMKRDKEAMENLDAYVKDLIALNPSSLPDTQDRLASWLNLYNAMVLREILKHYPVENLLKIPDYYGARRFKIGAKDFSLMEIEEVVFKQELQEPRTVFARINGASSAPRFIKEAFAGDKIDRQLEDRTLAFFKDPENLQYDAKRKVLLLNATLLWYEKEFIDLRGFLGNYLSGLPPIYNLTFRGYDWKLNDSKLH